MTSDALLRLIFPYLGLSVVGLIGFNVLRYHKFQHRHLLVGMFLAPLTVMVFSSLMGLDMVGFMVAYRSFSFIDIPLAIAAGVGLAFIVGKLRALGAEERFFKPMPAFAVAIFVLAAGMSLPLAYNGMVLYDVQDVTADYELSAMSWAGDHGISAVQTDQRLGDIIGPYFDMEADKTAPWVLIKGRALPSGAALLCSQSWTEEGAQMYPLSRVVFDRAWFDSLLDNSNICYSGGPRDAEMIIAIVG
jgi:hypothetical protein